MHTVKTTQIEDDVVEPGFKRDVVGGLERTPTLKRYETLERARSLRRALIQVSHDESRDSAVTTRDPPRQDVLCDPPLMKCKSVPPI